MQGGHSRRGRGAQPKNTTDKDIEILTLLGVPRLRLVAAAGFPE
jgi:hypothetical protein